MSSTVKVLAVSAVFWGEAVRFNRGKGKLDDVDFKYMRGESGKVYPYVSSQSFKKHWREALGEQPSPIIRSGRNQAHTAGKPAEFVDDDLFGYMLAGANAEREDSEESAENHNYLLEDIDFDRLVIFLKSNKPLSVYLLEKAGTEIREMVTLLQVDKKKLLTTLSEDQQMQLTEMLNGILTDPDLHSPKRFPSPSMRKLSDEDLDSRNSGNDGRIAELNRRLLDAVLWEQQKRATTRRTAPIRMHSLVAFTDIRIAEDFQTMSRDVAITGLNSVLNPNKIGIYTAWLRTRILIETHRIGTFDIGDDKHVREILQNELPTSANDEGEIKKKLNPYSRDKEEVVYYQLAEEERTRRFQVAVRALANINNDHGPASGALHDGSLRPRGFIAAMMRCADSPFDFVWQGSQNSVEVNTVLLRRILSDYEDLFLDRKIYVGLPLDGNEDEEEKIKDTISRAGFEPVVGTPRKILLRLASEVTV